MIRRIILPIILILVGLLGSNEAVASGKVALVIGNSQYANGVLPNPINDANLIADALRNAGFGSVGLKVDLKRRVDFERALRDFGNIASTADIAVVYYAGHGMESNGRNWMIPTEAKLGEEDDLLTEAIELDQIQASIRKAKVRIVILDACRNNPFSRGWVRTSRATVAGGLIVPQFDKLDDFVVIFAAGAGQEASDGAGVNSPFATALAHRIGQPDLPVQLLGYSVRDDVLAATNGKQRPFVSASITSTPVFLSATGIAVATGDGAGHADSATMDMLAWQGALRANTIEAYSNYRDQFGKNGRFLVLANANIKRLAHERPAPVQEAAASRSAKPEEEEGLTARLNQNVQDHNDDIVKKHDADMEAYRQSLADMAKTTNAIQDEYSRKVSDFKAQQLAYVGEQEKWKARAIACQNKNTQKCAGSATAVNPADMDGTKAKNDRIEWNEAVTICTPPTNPSQMASSCEGPMGSGSAVIGSNEGGALLAKTCGAKESPRDLGMVNGLHIFGCGFGLDPDGKRKGNVDVAAKAGLVQIPGRTTFQCTRKTISDCRKS